MEDKEKSQSNEDQLIRTIVLSSDWQEALSSIVVEQGLDPMNVNIIKLTDAFLLYLQQLKDFDFRIPARFILIAAILLTMKCETLLEKEEGRLSKLEKDEMKKLDLQAPMLVPPISRKPIRRVTLTELVAAMNKALETKKKKETFFKDREHMPTMNLPEPPEDIENKIESIYDKIKTKGFVKFSDLVPVWKRKEIINIFMPLLHLSHRGMVDCEQEEIFKEIYIKLK